MFLIVYDVLSSYVNWSILEGSEKIGGNKVYFTVLCPRPSCSGCLGDSRHNVLLTRFTGQRFWGLTYGLHLKQCTHRNPWDFSLVTPVYLINVVNNRTRI